MENEYDNISVDDIVMDEQFKKQDLITSDCEWKWIPVNLMLIQTVCHWLLQWFAGFVSSLSLKVMDSFCVIWTIFLFTDSIALYGERRNRQVPKTKEIKYKTINS